MKRQLVNASFTTAGRGKTQSWTGQITVKIEVIVGGIAKTTPALRAW
jgi:hypothetical protein